MTIQGTQVPMYSKHKQVPIFFVFYFYGKKEEEAKTENKQTKTC